MAIGVLVADGSGKTGELIRQMLRERGVDVLERDATHNAVGYISYGVPGKITEKPILNNKCGGSKYDQLVKMKDMGIPVPPFANASNLNSVREMKFPILGRKLHHKGGTDIMVTMQPEDVPTRMGQGAAFFTEFIPIQTEYRVWIYRRQHLGTYEKFLQYPEKYKRVGRNYANGFAFRLVTANNIPREAVDIASKTVQGLGLDFGAVDILKGTDGKLYVLEVNTAPGVEGENRQVIQSLVDKMARWVSLGFPKRKGE